LLYLLAAADDDGLEKKKGKLCVGETEERKL